MSPHHVKAELITFKKKNCLFFYYRSKAWPLNPSMEVEGRKKQSLSSSTVEALVKEQYVANKGETPGPRGPPFLYATPPHPGNHEMSAGQMVQGSEYVPLKKGPVPPSAPNPTTHGR